MEVKEHVVSAGRAVLDMVEREWQPLSSGELELRLDQAVEEILESELRAQLEAQPAPAPPAPPAPPTPATIYLQLLQSQVNVESPVLQTVPATPTPEEEAADSLQSVHGAAVKCIADLLQSAKSRVRVAGRARLSLFHTVLLSLTLLSERLSYRCVSRRFQLEKGNIHRIFFSFCECINTLQEKIIRWPEAEDAIDALVPLSTSLVKEQQQQEEQQAVPQVLGVLGHTRVPIRLLIGKHDVESTLPEVKRMRREAHPDSWLNLELVCDRRGRFLHCRVSRGSDVERGLALSDKLRRNPELMPPGSVLVARAGYPLSARVLTPYTSSPGPREELFNKTLEEHFHTFDQAVANLRARFQRLRYLDIGSYDRARVVALTACVLQNVLLDIGQVVEGVIETEETTPQDGDMDEEGLRTRDAIAELLFTNSDNL